MVSAAGRGSAMEVERRLHDALCARVRYNLNGHATEIHTAVGALVDGEAVCEGYTDAFYLLCSLAGIPARYQGYDAVGRGGEGGHIWNLVRIDGAWVMVDVTWDDDEESPVTYHYFNIGKDRARETHLWHEDRVRVPWIDVTRESLQPEDARETKISSLSELTAAARAAVGKTGFRVLPSVQLSAQAEQDFGPFWQAVHDAGVKDLKVAPTAGYRSIHFHNLEWWPEIVEEARGGAPVRRVSTVSAMQEEARRQTAARATRFVIWSTDALDLSQEASYRALNRTLNEARVSHFDWTFSGKRRVEVYNIRY